MDVFVKDAAGPISDVLMEMAALDVEEVAKNLPDLMGFLGSFKDELCREGLSKRLSQQLLGRLPTQRPVQDRLLVGAEHDLVHKLGVVQRAAWAYI